MVKKTKRNEFISTVITIILAFVFFKFIILLGVIPSESMEPTVHKGNIAIVNGLKYISQEPQRGDIVIFKSAELKETLIKRVVGLPGETISFENGCVSIDGQIYEETYLEKDVTTNCLSTFTVPDGCYFLLGDNRENSFDARCWKNPYISKEDIKGKYIIQMPLNKCILW